MAPGNPAPGKFRGGGTRYCLLPIDLEAPGNQAVGADGSILAASILRAPAILLCGTYVDGQRLDAQRVEATRAVDGHVYGHVAHRKIVLQERGQARTPTEVRLAIGGWSTRRRPIRRGLARLRRESVCCSPKRRRDMPGILRDRLAGLMGNFAANIGPKLF